MLTRHQRLDAQCQDTLTEKGGFQDALRDVSSCISLLLTILLTNLIQKNNYKTSSQENSPAMLISSACAILFADYALAHVTAGRTGYGFIGYGINMYHPWCASACRDSISTNGLICDDTVSHHGEHPHDTSMGMKKRAGDNESPSVECIASNVPYLQSVAYCIETHCEDETAVDQVEDWWKRWMLGRAVNQPIPNLTFSQSLASLSTAPNVTLGDGAEEVTTLPVLVDEETYVMNYNAAAQFETIEETHARYGIILLVTCAAIPIAISALSWLPYPASLENKLRAHLFDAPLLARPVTLPWIGPVNVPTRGQSLFMLYIIGMNIILSAAGYRSKQPNAWFPSSRMEISTYVANRAGVLSFANVPLLILFAGRNNILLSLTNWSHSTFLLLHKVVAVLATLEACLHSAMYLQFKVADGTYEAESKLDYWIWGIVGTLVMSLLLPCSIRAIRQRAYEVFLITHILLSIIAIVGCWYHIIYRFSHQWGYDTWLYTAIAVWAFDRLVRFFKFGRFGLKRAIIYQIDDDYLRIYIPGIKAHGHVYVYFPTLTWRVWENHPFSVASSMRAGLGIRSGALASAIEQNTDAEKALEVGSSDDHGIHPFRSSSTNTLAKSPAHNEASLHQDPPQRSTGITLFVRNQSGLTRLLSSVSVPLSTLSLGCIPSGIPAFVEGSYGASGHHISDVAYGADRYPNVLFLIGGVGITAFLPLLRDLRRYDTRILPLRSVTLYWGVRTQALVDAVEHLLYESTLELGWGMIETHVSLTERLDIEDILEKQLSKRGTMVFVCGPKEFSNEARRVVMRHAGQGAVVKLVDEKFDW
ncbi:ferric reductase like transmembrane component-domain-containing protein [Kockovaella imperatae]|uniref:Ferric reductase like transmembrane component-domain-containing protein n=1 Tax=Kockovaella imperatae TaxID=4999 RepID=A0A1Y1URK9_9TREE|nr:ferric reductase like transmembrane component-domain-containing protein [Kockovaella imperatae]ORX40124.1 ferric reductase like transmembrane component-domain-containing protein [Kockovaella imperatae]